MATCQVSQWFIHFLDSCIFQPPPVAVSISWPNSSYADCFSAWRRMPHDQRPRYSMNFHDMPGFSFLSQPILYHTVFECIWRLKLFEKLSDKQHPKNCTSFKKQTFSNTGHTSKLLITHCFKWLWIPLSIFRSRKKSSAGGKTSTKTRPGHVSTSCIFRLNTVNICYHYHSPL